MARIGEFIALNSITLLGYAYLTYRNLTAMQRAHHAKDAANSLDARQTPVRRLSMTPNTANMPLPSESAEHALSLLLHDEPA